MKISREDSAGQTLLTLDGELDMSTVPLLREQVSLVLAGTRPDRLVVDASELSFCDSAGIQALIIAHTEADQQGVTFELLNPHDLTRRTLEITGVLGLLTAGGQ